MDVASITAPSALQHARQVFLYFFVLSVSLFTGSPRNAHSTERKKGRKVYSLSEVMVHVLISALRTDAQLFPSIWNISKGCVVGVFVHS